MEVISFHVDTISRRKGRSAVQMAAYCAREKLTSEYTGETFDYTEKQDLVYHEILLPRQAPSEFCYQETLWNSVEKIEKCRDSRLARVVIVSLPKELRCGVQCWMVRQYALMHFVSRGMCADISVHDKGDGNPHAHILLTTRSLDRNGQWMFKQKRNYLLDEKGNRLRDPMTQRYLLGKSIKVNDWDEPERIEEWREGWANICNEQLRKYHIEKEVTHLSYARQGVDRVPTKHLGAKVKALENRGILTDRSKENLEIKSFNHKRNLQRFREQLRGRDLEIERTH